MHVDRNPERPRQRGDHLRFFGYSVARYYLKGGIKPGRMNSWSEFEKSVIPPMGHDNPTSAIGSIEEVRRHVRGLEEAGVDQMLLMHQGGKMQHDWSSASLELFAREIMPEFQHRHAAREAAKMDRLAPALEAAMARKAWPRPLSDDEIPVVGAYGGASFIPSAKDAPPATLGVSEETKGALGIA